MKIGYAGSIAIEIAALRKRNQELESEHRNISYMRRVIDEQAREIHELQQALGRAARRPRQPSGRRAHCGAPAPAGDSAAGGPGT